MSGDARLREPHLRREAFHLPALARVRRGVLAVPVWSLRVHIPRVLISVELEQIRAHYAILAKQLVRQLEERFVERLVESPTDVLSYFLKMLALDYQRKVAHASHGFQYSQGSVGAVGNGCPKVVGRDAPGPAVDHGLPILEQVLRHNSIGVVCQHGGTDRTN